MKLRNKKTGEIVERVDITIREEGVVFNNDETYNSLAELSADWEDYEEPKGSALDLMILTLTNFIENEPDEDKVDLEDCKRMLEKLKAWKRLEDEGFVFCGKGDCLDTIKFDYGPAGYNNQDFNLLFGGEE